MTGKRSSQRGRGSSDTGAGRRDGPDDLLLLTGADGQSPWFDEEDEEGAAFDFRRVFIAALITCAIVAAAIAGIFWLLQKRADPDIVADGSVIEAPDRPYKTRPADPEGMQVAGTGDVSFEVAEGRGHEGMFAPGAFGEEAEGVQESSGTEIGVVGVQVGAFATKEAAQQGWARMRARSETLQGRTFRIVEGSADSSPVFGLQAVAAGAEDAASLCDAIRAAGGDCQIKR